MAKAEEQTLPGRVLWPLLALVGCALLWPALVTFDAGDWPSPHQYPSPNPTFNACGPIGAWCAYYLRYWLGDGAYLLMLFVTLAALTKLIRGDVGRVGERVFGLLLLVPGTAAAVYLAAGPPDAAALPVGAGGVIGYALGQWLTLNLSRLGTVIVLGSTVFVGLIFATEGWVLRLPALVKRAGTASGQALAAARVVAQWAAPQAAPAAGRQAGVKEKRREPKINTHCMPRSAEAVEVKVEPSAPSEDAEVESLSDEQAESAPAAKPGGKRVKAKPPPINIPVRIEEPLREAYPRQIENWTLPPLSLLGEPERGFNAEQETIVRAQAQTLERTLEEFRLDARVVEIDTGPVITMFELKLGVGIKVSQIASLSNDIARALKAHAIRVVAPISGKNTVGIEVPNVRKETVRLKELMLAAGAKASRMALPLFLGKDAGGQSLVADLTKMPHLLIAGTTGSGKSVCLNSVIASFLMTQRPDRVKMILVDPKMVEMSQFKGMPHLMCPIITDMARAEKILEWAVTKMEERYELLAEARVKNMAGFNALGAEEIYERFQPSTERERALIPTRLPYIVVIIDELADLMMTAAKEVEHHLSRLAQKSRAVGIHIIVATQRPEAKVVTGLIKSNLPCRIAFRVASRMDSRIVLDQNGGEVLMGQGDMLFLPPGSHKLTRAQGTFMEDSETHAVLEYLAEKAEPEFHPELMRLRTAGTEGDASARDPLFSQAVRIVLESKRGSVSLLQRRLTVGYSRASRLIDQMADAGIVGEYKGSQAREVMMTLKEWEALQQQVAADLDAGYEADEEENVDVLGSDEEEAAEDPVVPSAEVEEDEEGEGEDEEGESGDDADVDDEDVEYEYEYVEVDEDEEEEEEVTA